MASTALFPLHQGLAPTLNHEELHASFPLHAALLFTQSIELNLLTYGLAKPTI